jgi:hypothetical protein
MLDSSITTFWTLRGGLCLVTAKMAREAVIRPMKRQGETTIGTAADMSALLAEQGGGEPAAVQEENCLLAEFQAFFNPHL